MTDDSGEDEEETFSKIDMDSLRQRGKGSYYCPLGKRCDKGGVDKTGTLILFDRNSSFAYVCHLLPKILLFFHLTQLANSA